VPLAYIALGSNLGDRLGYMQQALAFLESGFAIEVLRASPVYQNRAIGMGAGADDFLNAVVEIRTSLKPMDVLDACLAAEEKLGRRRSGEGWASRTIDLDLLFYEGICCHHERLTLPHPRIAERDFVAVPMGQLSPDLEIYGRALSAIVDALKVIDLEPTNHNLLNSGKT